MLFREKMVAGLLSMKKTASEETDMFDKSVFDNINIMAREMVKGQSAVEEKYGKGSFKQLYVSKRNKKTFVITAEMKDGTVEQIRVKY